MMNRFNRFAVATVIAAALPSIALAQAQPSPAPTAAAPDPAAMPAPTPDQANMAPSAAMSGANTSTGPVSADQLPPGQAQALATGDNKMVTNGPVPDTLANRAKYGRPMSHAGKKTAPAGN